MLAFLIVTGIFTLLCGILLFTKYSILDAVLVTGISIWSGFILFGHIVNTGYAFTVMIYFAIGALVNFVKADKKSDPAHLAGGLIFGGLAIWAACMAF